MTGDLDNFRVRAQRTRRSIMKMGSILAPAILANAVLARATPVSSVCAAVRCNCLLKGTKIQTTEGEANVEDLAIGDRLPTVFGGLRPVQWIGRYRMRKSDPANLYVTAGHALLIDGVLAPAEMLINGTTITRFEAREYDELEFFHIKFERHDVIYAEGAPVETLLKVDESAVNFSEYFRRYGTPMIEEARCAPHVYFGGRVGELKSRIRSAISLWSDWREQADVVRDLLEEWGITLSGRSELVN
jgi:hypothetical protein